jgi:S-DNA-T family DNA segregation ATPase FtsK/SpoIIIE
MTEEQRREIGGVALLAVALFFLLALLPVSVLGERGGAWFPSSNMMGPAGGVVGAMLVFLFGASAVLAPVVIGIGGLHVGDWLSTGKAVRFAILSAGLLVLVPILSWILGAEAAAGWLGAGLGGPLVDFVGPLGAGLVTGVALVTLSVGTLGWNPLRSLFHGMLVGGDAAGRTARVLAGRSIELAERGKDRAAARAERRSVGVEPDAAEPVAGLAPEWLDRGDPGPAPAGAVVLAAADPDPDRATAEEASQAVDDAWVEALGEVLPGARGDPLEAPYADGSDPEDTGGQPHGDEFPDELIAFDHTVPPVDLLSAPEHRDRESMDRQLDELGRILVEKLRTFNVQSELGGRTSGPMVTQFEVIPAPGVKVNRIANLDADLALAMKAHAIRIVAPIPGKGAVGVEIPNPRPRDRRNLRPRRDEASLVCGSAQHQSRQPRPRGGETAHRAAGRDVPQRRNPHHRKSRLRKIDHEGCHCRCRRDRRIHRRAAGARRTGSGSLRARSALPRDEGERRPRRHGEGGIHRQARRR